MDGVRNIKSRLKGPMLRPKQPSPSPPVGKRGDRNSGGNDELAWSEPGEGSPPPLPSDGPPLPGPRGAAARAAQAKPLRYSNDESPPKQDEEGRSSHELTSVVVPARGEKPCEFISAEVEISTRAILLTGVRRFVSVKLESFGNVGMVYAAGPKSVLIHFKDIEVVRVEDRSVVALTLASEKYDVLIRHQSEAVNLAKQVGKWVEFVTARPLREILQYGAATDRGAQGKGFGWTSMRLKRSPSTAHESEREPAEDEEMELPEMGNESMQFESGAVDEVYVSQTGAVRDRDHLATDEDDATTTLILEMMDFGIEEEPAPPEQWTPPGGAGVTVCSNCSELFGSSHVSCPYCGEQPL
jgi:hypothetical protein